MIDLRVAGPDDAARIAALHTDSWRTAYAGILADAYLAGPIAAERLAVWQDRFAAALPRRRVILAEDAGTAIGFVCAERGADPVHGGLVDNLHVLPDRRGHGIGERLIRAAAGWLMPGPMYLWVYAANAGGRRFYARLGGAEADSQPGGHPADGGKPVVRVVWPDAAVLAAG